MDRIRSSRSRLFLGTAGLALAAALAAPQQARAQAFNANETVVSGTASRVFSPGSNQETITVSSPTAVIDWTPQEDNFGNALTFLPDGNTAFFQDAPGQGGFAVLNRILPSTNGNIVAFDGRVVSQLQDAAGNFTPGGFVAFYSPTGILVGNSAVFDVGQLLLTSLDVDPFSFDAFYTQGGSLFFSGPAGSTTGVEIQAGASINAPAEESFLIVAAPQVIMGGSARINGSTAYVAGTEITIGYSNGLFDIRIPQGTTVNTAINHSGSTGGPASTGAGDNHLIYGVAASQANPITMLFGGNLGFDPAVSASIENGDIILAANHNVSGRFVAGSDVSDPFAGFFGGNESGSARADISITPGTYSSRLTAAGTHSVQAVTAGGDVTFTDDVTLIGRETARLLANSGFTLSVGGNARADASDAGEATSNPESLGNLDAQGGTASIAAETGGLVAITGNATVQANGIAGYNTSFGIGGSGAGGTAEIVGNNGTIDISGSANVFAFAAGFETSGLTVGGTFTGGTANILARDGGSVSVDGDAFVDTSANSAVLDGAGAQAGQTVTGGTSQIGTAGTGGDITIGGVAFVTASATGRNGGSAAQTPGLVSGGRAALFTGAGGTIDVGGDVELVANADGHNNTGGGQGGDARGGQAVLQSNGTSISVGGMATLNTSAAAGNGGSIAGARGGSATGGLSSIDASTGTIDVTGLALLGSLATGGDGGIGGDAVAGRSQVLAFGTGAISLGSAFLSSNGFGGNALNTAGDGGSGEGGETEIATGGGSIFVTGDATLVSVGEGGDGHNGGAATSRLAGIYAVTGSIVVGGNVGATAQSYGGNAALGFGGQGGDATGGAAYLQADGDNTTAASITVSGSANLSADGTGGTGGLGDGGAIAAGRGGTGRGGLFDGTPGSGGAFAIAGRDRGSITLGNVQISANGIGGNGGQGGLGQTGGLAGNGFGGTAQAGTFTGGGDGSIGFGTANYGDVNVFATGVGGVGGAGPAGQGIGGNGIGGNGFFNANESDVTAGAVQVFVGAFGGIGGTGGNGTSGQASVVVSAGGSMTLVSLSSGGGGDGGEGTSGNGGSGEGSSTSLQNSGQLSVAGAVSLVTNGRGGVSTGGAGGAGQGGTATLQGLGGSANLGGAVQVHAFGFGGVANTSGQRGGNGIGGTTSTSVAAGATMTLGAANIQAGGIGGLGGLGGNGIGGQALADIAAGGQLNASSLLVGASSSGGDGTSGAGGRGDGGDAAIDYAGQLIVTGDATVIANGSGGASTGGAAGGGRGGDAAIQGTAGSANVGGTMFVRANGSGGTANSLDQRAGDGIGGSALVGVTGGATMALGAAQITSNGSGGSGASAIGGDGTGGSASMTADGAGSAIDIAGFPTTPTQGSPGPALLAANGIGGTTNGGTGVGGAGQGGTTLLSATAGASVMLAGDGTGGMVNYITSRGFGGDSSVAGGIGGTGTGGESTVIADDAELTVGEMVQSSYAQGGASANSGLSISGGDAVGGTRGVNVSNGGTMTGSLPGGGSGAQGGNGSGAGNGGDATGGLTEFTVENAVATLVGGNSFFAGATGGSGMIGGNATGGQVRVLFDNAVVDVFDASSAPGILRVGSEGNAAIGGAGVARGGDAVGDDIDIVVSGSRFGGQIDVVSRAQGGAASAGTGGNAVSGGASFVAIDSSMNWEGDNRFRTLAAGGDGEVGGDATGSAATVLLDNSDLVIFFGDGGVSVSDQARGGIGTDQGGAATGGTAAFTLRNSNGSGDYLNVTSATSSSGGDVIGGGAFLASLGTGQAAFEAGLVEASATTTGTGQASGGFAQVLTQGNGYIGIGDLTVSASDYFSIASFGDLIEVRDLTARAGGSTASQIQAVGGLLTAQGVIDIAVAGDLAVTTGQGAFIGGPSVTAPTAVITLDAGGTVSFAGDNDAQIGFGGQSLTITSTELDITDGARIGAETLNLNVRANSGQTIAGGDTEETGYTLTQAEAARIDAGDVRFATSSSGAASDDLLIRDLTISGSADDGIRSLEIEAGVARVEGVFAYVDAAATDSMTIFADRLEIVTPGGIGIVGSDGRPTGSFEFDGRDLWMADAETIDRLRDDRSFAGRDDLLATAASGSNDPLGYLRAGDVEFYIQGGGSLLTRNTGGTDTPGGITVTGTLSIESGLAAQPIDVFAYGRRLNPDGSFVTGSDFFALVNFNRTASGNVSAVDYTAASEFNDCVIETSDCGDVVEPPVESPHIPPQVTSPVTLKGPLATAIFGPSPAETNQQFGLFFPGLIQTAPPTEDGLVDDPVTSGGDSALFRSEQTEGGEAEECEVDDDGKIIEGEQCDDR